MLDNKDFPRAANFNSRRFRDALESIMKCIKLEWNLIRMVNWIMHLYTEVKTNLIDFRIACSPQGITAVSPAAVPSAAFEADYEKRYGTRPRTGPVPAAYRQALRTAVDGKKAPPVAIDWTGFTEFERKVLKSLRKVRPGTVRTYAWLALEAGCPKGARAVGNVMARNPVPVLLPCHRIVPASGGIGNYGLGKKLKRELLAREGVAQT
jgi:O-6-methylguanine DNA methyltransferase